MGNAREKITSAAISLFAKKGYDGTTTKEIAEAAGVSEVTVFRLFENKKKLYKSVIEENLHPYKVKTYLEESVTYDLETDLTKIADIMLTTFKKNLPLIQMIVKGHHQMVKDPNAARGHGPAVKGCLKAYFDEMYKRGKLNAPPKYTMRFFLYNLSSVYNESLFKAHDKISVDYYHWMIKRVIDAIK